MRLYDAKKALSAVDEALRDLYQILEPSAINRKSAKAVKALRSKLPGGKKRKQQLEESRDEFAEFKRKMSDESTVIWELLNKLDPAARLNREIAAKLKAFGAEIKKIKTLNNTATQDKTQAERFSNLFGRLTETVTNLNATVDALTSETT
jgi:hypothetical protein